MRILHTADWHLGKYLDGASRLDEQECILQDFARIVEEQQIDLIIIAGDVFDTGSPTPRAERLFYDTVKQLTNHGQRLCLVIAGNHDNPDRLLAANALAKEHGILLLGTPKTMLETGTYGKHQVVDAGEGYVEIELHGERAVVLCVPFPSERRLNEVLYQAMEDDHERLASYEERMALLFAQIETKFREDTINLVTAHIFAMGSVEGGSERSIQLGGSYIINASNFPKQAQYIALGHIHKPQIVPGTHGKARYSGSPLAYSRNEANTTKQCLIVDVVANQEAKIMAIDLPVYKPIEVWKCSSIEAAIAKCEEHGQRSCYVYLEIDCDRYIREDEIKAMKAAKADILEVIPHITSKESSSPRMVQERTFEEMFRAFYLKERNVGASEELISLLYQIIEEEDHETIAA